MLVRNTRLLGQSELIVWTPLVPTHQIGAWNTYSNIHQGWIDESFVATQEQRDDLNPIPTSIYRFGRYKGRTVLRPETATNNLHNSSSSTIVNGQPIVAPFWQMSRPPFDTSIVNFNALSDNNYQPLVQALSEAQSWVVGPAGPNSLIKYTLSEEGHDALHGVTPNDVQHDPALEDKLNPKENMTGYANQHPHTTLAWPVWQNPVSQNIDSDDGDTESRGANNTLVAVIFNIVPWDKLLQHLMPEGVPALDCVLRNSAGQAFSYRVQGPVASYVGPSAQHDRRYQDLGIEIMHVANSQDKRLENHMQYSLTVYPSHQLHQTYANKNDTPLVMAMTVGFLFLAMMATLAWYDRQMMRKNNKILDAAANSNAILGSLFPQDVKDRLLKEKEHEITSARRRQEQQQQQQRNFPRLAMEMDINKFFNTSGHDLHKDSFEEDIVISKPLADLYTDCTILFADIVGFVRNYSKTVRRIPFHFHLFSISINFRPHGALSANRQMFSRYVRKKKLLLMYGLSNLLIALGKPLRRI